MYPTDNCVVTPLMGAAFIGDAAAVKAMLAGGADINAKDKVGWTALTYAACKGHSEIIQLLEEAGTASLACFIHLRGTNMSAISDYESTTLMKAAWRGDTDAVTDLLDDGVDVNSKIAGGITALMFAAWRGHLATVQALLAKGAEVDARTAAGTTSLMCAAATGHTVVAQTLLDSGASVNAEARNGSTALMDATSEGYIEIVQMLQQAGGKQ